MPIVTFIRSCSVPYEMHLMIIYIVITESVGFGWLPPIKSYIGLHSLHVSAVRDGNTRLYFMCYAIEVAINIEKEKK